MPSPPLRVAVVSPHAVVRGGLESLLSGHPDRVTVVAYPDGVEPDVLLYDAIFLIDGDTADLAELVTENDATVLAISRDLRPELVARALATGVDGFVSIGVAEDELIDAVESAAAGAEVFAGSDTAGVHRPGGQVGLTEREVQVVTLIAQGYTNQEIARELYLSPNSIKTYVRTAYRKIGASSRSQAVSWAIRNGFPSSRR